MKRTSPATIRRALALLLSLAMLLPMLTIGSFAADPETIKLTADSSEAITVNAGENKILDLAGHNLTAVVTNKGTLTVIDSVGGGKIGFTTGNSDVQAAIVNEGTLTFDGAAVELIGTGGATQAVGIYNKPGATMSMKSGTIEAITNGTYWSYSILNEGTITEISGGTIRAIKNNANSGRKIMCINNRKGGVIKLISGGELYAYSKANAGDAWAMAIRNQDGAKIEKITGGTLRAEVDGTGGSDAIAIRNENGYVGEISGGLIEGITRGSNSGSEAVGLNNIGGMTVEKISGGTISAKALNGGSAKSFALRNEGNATIKEISGGNIIGYTSAGEWTFGIDNWENGIIEKISGGNISAIIDHTNAAPNGIAIANKGRIDEISGGTFYGQTRCNDGSAMGLRNQANATVTKISGGTFYARALSGNACKAYGIYNQQGTIGEITGDALIIGHTTATQYSFGIWNDSTINTISGGTIVGIIERSTGGYNTLAISNDNNGVIKNITGGVFYAYSSSPDGDTYAIRTRSNAKIENITGGAFYINKTGDNRILRTEANGKVTYASGYALSNAYSESGYKYVIPTGATVDESYVEGEALKIATVTNAGNTVATYKLYGTAINVASVNNTPYPSVEDASAAAGNGDTVTLLTDVAEAVIPADATIVLNLAGNHVTNITVKDGASVTVTGGFIDGAITGNATVSNAAVAGEVPADAVADGYTVTTKADAGYAYVIPTGGSVVELFDGDTLMAARIFDKDGKVVTTIGSTAKEGYILVGWSELKGVEPTIADDAVTAEIAVLYGTWARQPLYYFLGSSVTYGSATGGRSFVEEIAALYPIAYNKQAISGTTLVDNGADSYVQRLVNCFDPTVAPDRLIVQLSTNDASQNKPLGTVSDSKNSADFDQTTVIGAMEFIIAYAKETWDCPVAFYTNPYYNNATYEKMIDALYQLKEKWGIMIFDFYYYMDMEELPAATLSSYMADSIHPNATGYKWMAGIMGKMLMDADHANTEHAGVHVTTDPTCTEKGHTDFDCVICGEIVTAYETDALGHDYADGVCSECGEADPDYVPPCTHDYVDGVCSECGEADPDYVPPKTEEDPIDPPKTGDLLTAASVLAILSLAGAVCFSKKRRTH